MGVLQPSSAAVSVELFSVGDWRLAVNSFPKRRRRGAASGVGVLPLFSFCPFPNSAALTHVTILPISG